MEQIRLAGPFDGAHPIRSLGRRWYDFSRRQRRLPRRSRQQELPSRGAAGGPRGAGAPVRLARRWSAGFLHTPASRWARLSRLQRVSPETPSSRPSSFADWNFKSCGIDENASRSRFASRASRSHCRDGQRTSRLPDPRKVPITVHLTRPLSSDVISPPSRSPAVARWLEAGTSSDVV
jgi:hypothetical protein